MLCVYFVYCVTSEVLPEYAWILPSERNWQNCGLTQIFPENHSACLCIITYNGNDNRSRNKAAKTIKRKRELMWLSKNMHDSICTGIWQWLSATAIFPVHPIVDTEALSVFVPLHVFQPQNYFLSIMFSIHVVAICFPQGGSTALLVALALAVASVVLLLVALGEAHLGHGWDCPNYVCVTVALSHWNPVMFGFSVTWEVTCTVIIWCNAACKENVLYFSAQ